MMREQTFERHKLDSRVLLSENIADIQRIDGIHYKAGIVRNAADATMKQELLAIPHTAPYLMRPIGPFLSAEEAPAALKQDLSFTTLTRLSALTGQFCERADGRDVILIISRNLGQQKKLSLQLHFEGINPNGPSMDRDFRGNLSVSADDHPQMCWVPTEGMSEDDVRAILSPTAEKKPAYEMQHAASGDFIALHGLDYQHSNLVTDGLLHAGPTPHIRTTVLWGIRHPAF